MVLVDAETVQAFLTDIPPLSPSQVDLVGSSVSTSPSSATTSPDTVHLSPTRRRGGRKHRDLRYSRDALPPLPTDPAERASAIAARGKGNDMLRRLHMRHMERSSADNDGLSAERSDMISIVGGTSLLDHGGLHRIIQPTPSAEPLHNSPRVPRPPVPVTRPLPAGRPLRVLAELNGVPSRLLPAASDFDERHAKTTRGALSALREAGVNEQMHLYQPSFTARLREVQRNKYVEPVILAPIAKPRGARLPHPVPHSARTASPPMPTHPWRLTCTHLCARLCVFAVARTPRAVEVREWRLEESVWQVRSAWADSGTFIDTPETYEKAFNLDWSHALRSHGLVKYILKNDDGESDDEADEDGDGIADDELVEVGGVLWRHHLLIYRAFDAYASASLGDMTRVSSAGFKTFCSDCAIAEKRSATCGMAALDQLFIVVNRDEDPRAESKPSRSGKADPIAPSEAMGSMGGARAASASTGARDEDRRALNRQEWLQCLVRIAIMKYVLSKRVPDVSAALEALFTRDLEPNMATNALQDSNAFRLEMCYTEGTDSVLLARSASLRAVFDVYAKLDGSDMKRAHLAKLMCAEEWLCMLRDLDWIDEEFTMREASLAFSWARMRVIDENAADSRAKLENLSFEDFLDALVRVATMKALPSEDELAEAGAPDAGLFLLDLRKRSEDKQAWLEAHARRWDEPLPMPIERAVHHLCMLMIRTIQATTAIAAGSKSAAMSKPRDAPADVTAAEVGRFRDKEGMRNK